MSTLFLTHMLLSQDVRHHSARDSRQQYYVSLTHKDTAKKGGKAVTLGKTCGMKPEPQAVSSAIAFSANWHQIRAAALNNHHTAAAL